MISVFGSSGFIGSRFCEIYPNFCFSESRENRTPKYDTIINFISTTDNYNVYENSFLDVDTNIKVMLEILDGARKKFGNNFLFTQISSWFVYGKSEPPVKEDDPCNPNGFYSITKRAAEQLLISYCETFDIPYKILRLSNVIGETDKGVSKKKNALQYLIGELKKNNPIDLYYGGHFFRDYLYVDDICRGIFLAHEHMPYNDIINIGSGQGYRFLDLIEYCKKILNSTSEINTIEPSEFHKVVQVKDMYLDTSKIQSYRFKPQVKIEEALRKICYYQ